MILKDISQVDLEKIPVPDFPTLDTNVKTKGTILVNIKDIYIDDHEDNVTRQHGINIATTSDLQQSFSKRVDLQQFPPAIRKRKGNDKKYELVYGFHRIHALLSLGVQQYMFTLIECTDSGLIDVRILENEGLVKLYNTEQDVKSGISQKIRLGYLDNTEPAIRNLLNKVCPDRKQSSKEKIIQWILEDNKTPQRYTMYNNAKIKLWEENHSSFDYGIGKLNEKYNEFVAVLKEGNHPRTIAHAFKRYCETGQITALVLHVDAPTDKKSIEEKRRAMIETIEEWQKNYREFGVPQFMYVKGFLPQDNKVDNFKKLVVI